MPPKGASGHSPIVWITEQGVDLVVNVFFGAFDPVLSPDRAGEEHGFSEIPTSDVAVVLGEPGDPQGVEGVVSVPEEVAGVIVDDPQGREPHARGEECGVLLDYVVVECSPLLALVGESDVVEFDRAAVWSIVSHGVVLFLCRRMKRMLFMSSMDSTAVA